MTTHIVEIQTTFRLDDRNVKILLRLTVAYFCSAAKSYKCVHFGSSSRCDFSIAVQPILKKFTVLETVIQGRRFCSLTPKWGSSESAIVYALREMADFDFLSN